MSGSDPLDQRTWTPVLDIVSYVNEFVSSSRKVLILDSGRIRENWPVGILHNGFADALQVALQEKPVDRLFVLNSTRLDQRAHAAPELGGSVFAWFVAAGLRGAADTNQDKRVKLQELYEYLQNHVDSWVNQNRSERQRPLLIPEDAKDFGLTYVTDYERPDAEPVPPIRTRRHDRPPLGSLCAPGAGGPLPHRTAGLRTAAPRHARLETLNLSGEAYGEQFNATAAAIELALTSAETDAVAQRLTLTSGSTVLRQRLGQLSESEIQAARDAFSKWRQKPEGPPQEQIKTPYPAACAAVWRDLIDQAPENPRQRIDDACVPRDDVRSRRAAQQGNRPAGSVRQLSRLGHGRAFVRRAILTQDSAERAALPEDARATTGSDSRPMRRRPRSSGTGRVVCGGRLPTCIGRAALDRTDRRRHGGPIQRHRA